MGRLIGSKRGVLEMRELRFLQYWKYIKNQLNIKNRSNS